MSESSSVVSLFSTFAVSKLADMPAKFAAPSGFHVSRMIYKGEDKASMYAVLPDVTDGFVTLFLNREEGRQLIHEYIQDQLDKAARASYEKRNDGNVHAADIGLDALIQFMSAESQAERMTKESLGKAFDSTYHNRIAFGLALERDPEFIVIVDSGDTSEIETYWNSEAGLKFMGTAQNYKQFILRATERNASFESQAIKDKVLNAVSLLDTSPMVAKLIEKLTAIPVATVDDSGL